MGFQNIVLLSLEWCCFLRTPSSSSSSSSSSKTCFIGLLEVVSGIGPGDGDNPNKSSKDGGNSKTSLYYVGYYSLFQASNFCTVSGSISDLTPSFTTSQRPCKIFAKLGKSDCGIFCSISLRLSKIRLPTHSCCGLAGEHFRFSKGLA